MESGLHAAKVRQPEGRTPCAPLDRFV